MSAPYFTLNQIKFRAVERRDLDLIRMLRNDETTWSRLTDPRPLGPADQEKWYQSLGSSSGKVYFSVFSDEHPFIGIVRMDEIDTLNRSIRVGADVIPELRGVGLGKAVYKAIKSYAFDVLGVHRVWLQVLKTNQVARRLYEKMGFIREGIMRDAVFRYGVWVDYIVMSILEEAYRRDG